MSVRVCLLLDPVHVNSARIPRILPYKIGVAELGELDALPGKQIAAAGLDVLPKEPTIREETELLRFIFAEQHELQTLVADHMLIHQPNVLVNPHNAFNTWEAVESSFLLRANLRMWSLDIEERTDSKNEQTAN
jgi:phosphoglycerate dehydrogenase-like enzyme